MEFEGKREMESFIAKWSGALSPKYKQIWEMYKRDRDVVATKLHLDEKEKMLVTVMALSNIVVMELKANYFIQGDTEAVVRTKGNTKALSLAANMTKLSKEYEKRCAGFINKYTAEMNKLANSRR